MQYHRDKEYMTYVGQLIQHPKVQKLADIPHHIHSNRLEHSIHVSYDWRETKFTKSHAWIHPRIAVRNARKITDLNAKEEDIIIKHMWGATLAPPRYKESFVVTMVDKYWAVKEASEPWRKKMAKRRFFHRKMLKS